MENSYAFKLNRTQIHADIILKICVLHNEIMQWYQGNPLTNYLENVHNASDGNLIDMRFPVQYVSRLNLDFGGYCRTAASGVVRKGDEIIVLPSRKTTRVKWK